MSEIGPIDSDAETVALAASVVLAQQGFRVMRSFDLRSALAAHADCVCPYHGTAQCTCQFIVLLVYNEVGDPVVVTAHSHSNQVRLQVVRDETTCSDPRLAAQVMAALVEAAAALSAATCVRGGVDAA